MAESAPHPYRHDSGDFFDNVGAGVGVVDHAGEIVWMSSRLAEHSPETLRIFTELCSEAIVQF